MDVETNYFGFLFAEIFGDFFKVKFGEPEVEPTLSDYSFNGSIWMAPEILKKNSKPVSHCQSKILYDTYEFFYFQLAASDVFSLGLLFFFMLTKRESPLAITTTFSKGKFHHTVKINLQLLEALKKNTDTILFVDLIKRMIQEDPDQREICENLIEHAALKDDEERLKIVRDLADKCFDGDTCRNEYLVKVMDKKEVHMEGSLGENSAEWKEFLAEAANNSQLKPEIKSCSSLVKIFYTKTVIKSNYKHFFL